MRRYIQPAEPVYQVQPPRPVCGCDGVDVGGHDVRLDAVYVATRLRRCRAWLTGLISRKAPTPALASPIAAKAITVQIGGVRVLAAILAHAGDVALDVAGIESRFVERRIEKLDRAERRGGPGGGRAAPWPDACRFGSPGAGENRPALRDGIDLAFRIGRRAERRAVVEVGAAIPLAVPAVLFDIAAQPAGFERVACRRRRRRRRRGRGRRTASARRTGRTPARRSRPCRAGRPDSCRRSSRRSPSAASRARRSASRVDRADAMLVERADSSTAAAGRSWLPRPARRAALAGTDASRRARRCRRWRAHSGRRRRGSQR